MIRAFTILFLAELCFVSSYKSGAPVSMCASMTPSHAGVTPQKTSSPYKLVVSKTEDETYIVDIQGSRFAGFLIQARKNISVPESVGTFTTYPDYVKTLNCNGINNAITHTHNKLKDGVEAEWEAPEDFAGQVTFIGTVVANYTTFWTNVLSSPIEVEGSDTSPVPGESSGTDIPQALYQDCGIRKNCLGFPHDCIEQKNCRAIVAVSRDKQEYVFEMMALQSKYVAVGLSEDEKMGADQVVECVFDNYKEGFETVNAYRSWNIPNNKANERLDASTVGLTLIENNYNDGSVYCKVHVSTVTSVGELNFDLTNNQYYLLLAAGSQAKENGVSYHDVGKIVAHDKRQVTDVSPVKVHDSFYDGCDVEKNCFGFPDGCVALNNCKMVSSIVAKGTSYIFKLKSKVGTYIALGLSRDNKMGEDSVMECVHEQGDNVQVYMSWNKPGEKANTRDQVDQSGVQVVTTKYDNGEIYCEFTRDVVTVVQQNTYDLAKDNYNILLVSGSSLKERGVGYHDVAVTISSSKRSLSDVGAFKSTSKLFLRLHGSFMIAAWIGTASIGIIFARYFKQTWVESSLCAKDLWFAWHRFFMLITWCLTLIAFVLIFVEVGGWVEGNSQMHGILGCVTTLLCFLQPIGAAFRPHPTARNRPVFNWLHWLVGNAAHIFAVVTIFFAIPLAKAELPDWLDWILVAFVALYVSVHLLLTIAGCISERKSVKRVSTFPMKDLNTSRSALNSIERKQDAPHSGFRKFLLFIHIVGITALTVTIITIIALAPIEAQWSSLQKKLMST
ncbi:putative ferric-chelate reductase 1 homolog [Cimex lectularius]|uniref:Ferric-chelate reductase 1 homolog n=1 Tax=Cimex lectularius TaxID=79782 RepID=A0A8I6RFA0_CIMLE|nr:putative ferric-chelate reductase 1 homolog [Cimex lectularius]